jgi:NADH-quinone oxidoreductase E subunit
MSGVHIAPPELQPAGFAFTAENLELAKKHIAKYPAGRQQSAVMPLLDLAQRQHDNWLPQAAIKCIAEMLGMPVIRVMEVASFYTMYNLAPVGKHFIQVCTTTPCWLAGSDKVLSACRKHLGIGPGETTADGQFTVIEVECLGACVNAPMLQYNDDFFEDLDEASTAKFIEALKSGAAPKPGPQNGRLSSEPLGGATTLTTFNPAGAPGGSDD